MKELYKLLGVDETATDKEIRKAYEDLQRKYDPGSYETESSIKYAKEQTEKITRAFDIIMNKRREKEMQNGETFKAKGNSDDYRSYKKNLEMVQELIESGDLQKADELLMSFQAETRTAGWYYLKGIVLYKKGWILESSNFFETAVRMDPFNEDYKKALEKVNWQKKGNFGNPKMGPFGWPYPDSAPFGCSFCDICGGIMCLDLCCDCGMPRGYGRCC